MSSSSSQQCNQRCHRFTGKVVIVTGSSSGIGADAAVEFGREGASLVLHGQNIERLQVSSPPLLPSITKLPAFAEDG